jgi:transcriptional regulator with XRE-family HTH domain
MPKTNPLNRVSIQGILLYLRSVQFNYITTGETMQVNVRQYVRQVIDADFGGIQKDFAKVCGVSDCYVSHVLSGRTAPGPKVLQAIGVRKVVKVEYEFCESVK